MKVYEPNKSTAGVWRERQSAEWRVEGQTQQCPGSDAFISVYQTFASNIVTYDWTCVLSACKMAEGCAAHKFEQYRCRAHTTNTVEQLCCESMSLSFPPAAGEIQLSTLCRLHSCLYLGPFPMTPRSWPHTDMAKRDYSLWNPTILANVPGYPSTM